MRCGILAALVCAAGISMPCWAQVVLVRGGEAQAVVVTADAPTPTARYAAEEFVAHVALATGAALPVLPESEAPESVHTRVYIGETAEAARQGIDTARLPAEAYVMRSVGNDLFIAGKEDDGDPLSQENLNAGTLFGVYEFLERFVGVRWLWPGPLGTYVPPADTLQCWAVNETATPALAFRTLVWSRIRAVAVGGNAISAEDARLGFSQEGARRYGEAVRVLLRRHRMGGAEPPTGHAFSGWWQRYGREHPEWFALRRDGTRGHPDKDYHNVPMCVTNEELQDFIVAQWDGESVLRLGPVDRPGRCICEKCRAWDGPQPDPPPWFAERLYAADARAQELFAGVTSDRYARFWKAVQDKARAKNPHAVVSISYLYENEFPAPVTGIQLNKNFFGEFVQWQDPHLRWFPMPGEAFDWIKAQWLGWRETGIRMGYRPNYLHDGYVMPHFETRQSGGFFKFAYAHGMEGARFDSLTGQWAAQGLRLYMHLRLMAKPGLTLDAIRAEYLEAFGPAAGAMDRYFDYWEQYAFDNHMRFIKLYWDVGWRYSNYVRCAHKAFPPACFAPAEALLEEALAAASQDARSEFAERVRFIGLGLEHAQLAARLCAAYDGREAAAPAKRDEAKRALQALVAFRKQHEHTFFSDLLHVTSFWERTRLNVDALVEPP